MTDDWPFADPPNVAAITTRRVLDGSRAILLVTHDADDGAWQMLCGTTNDTADARVVSLRSLVARDPSLHALADLPLGWRAWRADAASPWERGPREQG